MNKLDFFKLFKYNDNLPYKYTITQDNTNENINISEKSNIEKTISKSLDDNFEYLKYKYNLLISSDIKYKNFNISIQNKKIPALLFYIDGLVNDDTINNYILKPLFYRNNESLKNSIITIHSKRNHNQNVRKINIEKYVSNVLIPENNISIEKEFKNVISKINSGFTALFIENLTNAILIETKSSNGRSIQEPTTEYISYGSHEGLVENIRINTSMIRRIINNENLVVEEQNIGKITKTKVDILYMSNITNESLITEVKHRLNNLDIDYLISSGQLEQLIKDNFNSSIPEAISTERPDRISNYILLGRIAILIDGSPFALIIPSCFIDYISSNEDFNLNYHYSNFIKTIRFIASICALLIPGIYLSITMYHYELIPSELLFAIISAREAIPFPIIFEIIIMEACFELIQEASIRVSSSFSTTVGIIGALILGDAAVSANIVSPILIIIVAFSGICGFTIPDTHLRNSIRILRFIYIILGYLAGFLGIAFGMYVQFCIIQNRTSFGIDFLSPYFPDQTASNDTIAIKPIWKREKRNQDLNTKRPTLENNISMKWRINE